MSINVHDEHNSYLDKSVHAFKRYSKSKLEDIQGWRTNMQPSICSGSMSVLLAGMDVLTYK